VCIQLHDARSRFFFWVLLISIRYGSAGICYADDSASVDDHHSLSSRFRESHRYNRCWALQELITLQHVTFMTNDRKIIGPKSRHDNHVSQNNHSSGSSAKFIRTHKTSPSLLGLTFRVRWYTSVYYLPASDCFISACGRDFEGYTTNSHISTIETGVFLNKPTPDLVPKS